jgi:hypothetical protein
LQVYFFTSVVSLIRWFGPVLRNGLSEVLSREASEKKKCGHSKVNRASAKKMISLAKKVVKDGKKRIDKIGKKLSWSNFYPKCGHSGWTTFRRKFSSNRKRFHYFGLSLFQAFTI